MKRRLTLIIAIVALVACVDGGPVDLDSDVPIDGRVTIAWDGRTIDWGAPESLNATLEDGPAGSTILWRSLNDLYRGRPVVLGHGASITTAALRPGITTVEATLMMGDTQISRDVAEISVRYRESWNLALEGQVQYPNGTVGDVWVNGGRAYVARRSAGGISIVGLDGAAVEIGRFTADSLFTQDVKVADGVAYVSHEPVPGFTGYPFSVTLLDVSDPAAPLVVAGVPVEVAPSAHNLWIDGDLLTAAAGATDFSLFDVSDPAAPRLLSRIDPSPSTAHDAHVRNGLLFGSSMGFGSDPGRLTIVSILQPSSPAVLGEITFPPLSFTHSSWLSADGRFLYVAEENVNAPIRIYDVTDPADPRQVGAYQPRLGTLPHNFQVQDGRFAYLSHYKHGIEVIDVSDPTRPRLVGFYDTHPGIDEDPTGLAPAHDKGQDTFEGAWGVHWTDDGRIVASDMNRGLFVFRFTGPLD